MIHDFRVWANFRSRRQSILLSGRDDLESHELTKLARVVKRVIDRGAEKRIFPTEWNVLTTVEVRIHKFLVARQIPLVAKTEAQCSILVDACADVGIAVGAHHS